MTTRAARPRAGAASFAHLISPTRAAARIKDETEDERKERKDQMARTIIRKAEVRKRTGLSDTTIWRLEKAGDFPRRIQITDSGLVGWIEAEVEGWVHERIRGVGKRPPVGHGRPNGGGI